MEKRIRKSYARNPNQDRAQRRNLLKGSLKAIHTVISNHYYQDHLYTTEKGTLEHIKVQLKGLLLNWKPQIPNKK